MAKIFAVTRFLTTEKPIVRKEIKEVSMVVGGEGSEEKKYFFGTLEDIFIGVNALLAGAGYERINLWRRTDPWFFSSSNYNIIYSLKKQGFLWLPSHESRDAELIMGFTSCQEEIIGMTRTLLVEDDKDLSDKIRKCYERYSLNFIEKDVEVKKS